MSTTNRLLMSRVIIMFGAFLIIIGGYSNCFGDLTFNSSEIASKGESNKTTKMDLEVFPSPNGLKFFVNRSPALRILEKDIVSITIRETPTDPFLENAVKMAEKNRGEKQMNRILYAIDFRFKTSEARRIWEFAALNRGKTFALRLRTLTISMPTFVGPFLQGDEFSLVGVSDENIERISKMLPSLIKDERPNVRKK